VIKRTQKKAIKWQTQIFIVTCDKMQSVTKHGNKTPQSVTKHKANGVKTSMEHQKL
jgi:hypothetical protein